MSKQKKILIFGSSGMLGSYLSNMLEDKKYKEKGYKVIKNDRSTRGIDITDEKQIKKLITRSDCNYVVNCAAFTNVDTAEEEPEIAFKVNADAPKYMAEICKELNIPFIHISTDYIFGDNKEEGYLEGCEEFNPLSVYGVSKLEGEQNVLEVGGTNYILRTSWLFGPGATNFVGKIAQLARERSELSVVTDEVGCPTYVRDLSEGIVLALEEKIEPGIYHICSRDYLSRYEFAKEILKEEGIEIPVNEAKLADFPRKAQVPNISILLNTKLPEARTSTEMIKEYFKVV